MDDILYMALGSPASNRNGNTVVPVLDENDEKRKLNLNNTDNQWNDNYRFLARRKFPNSSALCGSFFIHLNLFAPSSKHFPDFTELLGQSVRNRPARPKLMTRVFFEIGSNFLQNGGVNWTRTSDLYNVNVAL